jgi:hypothetical protein
MGGVCFTFSSGTNSILPGFDLALQILVHVGNSDSSDFGFEFAEILCSE